MSVIKPASAPSAITLKGQFCLLEPLSLSHSPDLFRAVSGELAGKNHQYLFETPPQSQDTLARWITTASADPDLLFFAVINTATQKCGGRQALMRIRPEHGSIELGSILWGAGVARTAVATEAFYLTAKYIFDDLGYRRFEWKCNNLNEPSKRAAIRFGFTFEGIFRQHMIVKGVSRDTAWFSILNTQWPSLRARFERWLAPENFDETGRAKTSLSIPRQKLSG